MYKTSRQPRTLTFKLATLTKTSLSSPLHSVGPSFLQTWRRTCPNSNSSRRRKKTHQVNVQFGGILSNVLSRHYREDIPRIQFRRRNIDGHQSHVLWSFTSPHSLWVATDENSQQPPSCLNINSDFRHEIIPRDDHCLKFDHRPTLIDPKPCGDWRGLKFPVDEGTKQNNFSFCLFPTFGMSAACRLLLFWLQELVSSFQAQKRSRPTLQNSSECVLTEYVYIHTYMYLIQSLKTMLGKVYVQCSTNTQISMTLVQVRELLKDDWLITFFRGKRQK